MTWEYIAGFFDGEGSISHNGKGWRISIAQTNREVLEKIKIFSALGSVFEVTKRRAHWKDSWVFNISKQADVYDFLKKIRNKLTVKKDLAHKVIIELEKYIQRHKEIDEKRNLTKLKAHELRDLGWTYRKIGQELKIDFGYARRIILKK